jgi:exodeoxyribonuclease VII small subunit
MGPAKKNPSFEKDLEQLEAIVASLEEGGLSLDDSLKQFENGIRLARRCEKALTEAEKKIEILTKNAEGDLEAAPFGDEEEAEEEAASSTPEAAPANGNEDWIPEEEEEEGELLF